MLCTPRPAWGALYCSPGSQRKRERRALELIIGSVREGSVWRCQLAVPRPLRVCDKKFSSLPGRRLSEPLSHPLRATIDKLIDTREPQASLRPARQSLPLFPAVAYENFSIKTPCKISACDLPVGPSLSLSMAVSEASHRTETTKFWSPI